MNGVVPKPPSLAMVAAIMTIVGMGIGFVSNQMLFYSGLASRLTALETAQTYVGKELARLTIAVGPK